MDEYITYSDDDLSVDQKVEILAGPFAGFKGVIYSIDRFKNKVVVKVNFWGKDMAVELYFHQVKPVESSNSILIGKEVSKMSSLPNNKILNKSIFPIGALVILIIAYFLDKWLFTQTRLAHNNPAPTWYQDPIFVWTLVSGLILFIVWLGLGWIVLARSQRSLPISIIILIVGLIIYLYPFLQMIFIWLPYIFTNVRTPLSYSGLYIAILSILQLLLKMPTKTLN